jgi:hypothetical protein
LKNNSPCDRQDACDAKLTGEDPAGSSWEQADNSQQENVNISPSGVEIDGTVGAAEHRCLQQIQALSASQ